jgi:hypothetical protein
MSNKFTDGEDFLDEYVKDKEYIYIASVTKDYADMALNWHLSLKNIQSEHLGVVVSLDKICYEKMQKYGIPTVFYDAQIKSNATYEEWLENEKTSNVFGPIYINKKYKINIIHSEVDIVFLKNPIQKLREEIVGYDLVLASDRRFDFFYAKRKKNIVAHIDKANGIIREYGESYQSKHGVENFGFSYFNYSERIDNFFKGVLPGSEIFKNYPKSCEDGHLQTILIHRVKDLKNCFKSKTLSCFEFVNGSVWKIPYLKERIKDSCYIVHYNFAEDKLELKKSGKIDLMIKNNHWYL